MVENPGSIPSLRTISRSQKEALAKSKISFGHQSVGFNIVDGMRLVIKEHPDLSIRILETDDHKAFDSPDRGGFKPPASAGGF